MFGGNLQTVRFRYKGNIEVVEDRLPTAEKLEKREDGTVYEVDVYGTGIDIWFRSQGDLVEVLE